MQGKNSSILPLFLATCWELRIKFGKIKKKFLEIWQLKIQETTKLSSL